MSAPEAKLPSSGGLHTREDLTLVGRVHLWLRRASRNFYRQIRHPRSRRRGGWRKWFADRIHNRALWRPERNAVAAGVGGGLFLAMVPVPLQSLLAGVESSGDDCGDVGEQSVHVSADAPGGAVYGDGIL
jgi:hypothetical protein